MRYGKSSKATMRWGVATSVEQLWCNGVGLSRKRGSGDFGWTRTDNDAKAGSRNAIAEALTNIIWAPLEEGLTSVSLSANWMWACKNEGEDARLYEAVQSASDFAIALGINIPTGKDWHRTLLLRWESTFLREKIRFQ